jgi:hypothetical protein
MTTTHTRRTSVYTVRDLPAEAVEMLAAALRVPVSDRGEASVSYRASNDRSARGHALAALRTIGLPTSEATLTTGLGVHRREIPFYKS